MPPRTVARSAIPYRSIDSFNIPDLQFFSADSARDAMEGRAMDQLAEEGTRQVVMALRRLSERLPQPGESAPIMVGPRMGELTTRTELTLLTYRISEHSNECQRQLLTLADETRGSS